jgi:hypothetical protein
MFAVSLSWSLGLSLLIVPRPSLANRLWKERLVDIALSGDHKPFTYPQNFYAKISFTFSRTC